MHGLAYRQRRRLAGIEGFLLQQSRVPGNLQLAGKTFDFDVAAGEGVNKFSDSVFKRLQLLILENHIGLQFGPFAAFFCQFFGEFRAFFV